MSQHFVVRSEPPQGLSSFTKIRLGWIHAHQVKMVRPGESSLAFLYPLSTGGETLAVKIMLDNGTYYLVENRQRIGYDAILPDSGLLILKVNPKADEGYGTVKVQCPETSKSFDHATYALQYPQRNMYTDKDNDVVIIPVWQTNNRLGVLVTQTGPATKDAISAARAIQAIIDRPSAKSDKQKTTTLERAMAAFKENDFQKSYAIATSGTR